jgi:hypothetical protein
MNKIESIQREVEKLAPFELEAFRKWFYEFDAVLWDRQIQEDIQAGKLDALADAAIREFKSGKCSKL